MELDLDDHDAVTAELARLGAALEQAEADKQALASELAFTSRLVDIAHAIVLLLDPQGRVVLFNDYMAQLSGYSLDEVRGHDWFELFITEQERARIHALFDTAIDDVPINGDVNAIVTKDGRERQIEWYGTTLRDNAGELIGLLSIGWDVSDRLELQRKLGEAERMSTIGMMASMFAHEVGNPLNAIYLQAQLLRRRIDRPDPDQPLAPRVDLIMAEIRRLSALLEEFRGFYRPDQVRREPTDVRAVLVEVLEAIEAECESNFEVARDFSEALPRVLANADKLKQVFLNLCKNSLEAMADQGGGSLRLRVRAEGPKVVVEVRDTGPGLPADIDIFEPFCTTKPRGTGLGLPLVREIVRSHGGQVECGNSPEGGASFVVELPGC